MLHGNESRVYALILSVNILVTLIDFNRFLVTLINVWK